MTLLSTLSIALLPFLMAQEPFADKPKWQDRILETPYKEANVPVIFLIYPIRQDYEDLELGKSVIKSPCVSEIKTSSTGLEHIPQATSVYIHRSQ